MLIQKYRLSVGVIVGFGESYAVKKVRRVMLFLEEGSPWKIMEASPPYSIIFLLEIFRDIRKRSFC